MSKRIVIFALSILVLLIVFPVSAGEWKYGQFGTWYENSDGSRPTGGMYTINGVDYAFDEEGYIHANEWTYWTDGTCSYSLSDGRIAKNQWIDGIYYVDENGEMDCRLLDNDIPQYGSSNSTRDAYSDIEGESWDDGYGILEASQGGGCLGYIENGDWAAYHEVNFGSGAYKFIVNASALREGGYIDLHLDSLNGELIGSCKIENTGDWEAWRDFTCDVKNATGVHDLYLYFRGDSGYLFDINYFYFSCPGLRNVRSAFTLIKADRFNDQNGVLGENDGENIGYIKDNSWVLYKNLDFETGSNYLTVDASSLHEGGTIELRLDGLSGKTVGMCNVPGTGSWDNWKSVECRISDIVGAHDLYFVFHGSGSGYLMNIKQFVFYRKDKPAEMIPGIAAIQMLQSVGNAPSSSDPSPSSSLKAGSTFNFGHYEQDNNLNNGTEPIEWLVLTIQGDRALVISKYALDAIGWTDNSGTKNLEDISWQEWIATNNITWETSLYRKWLNNDFYDLAFSDEEKDQILLVTIDTPDNPHFGTSGGNNTEDHIFLLSIDEAGQYFPTDEARKLKATPYAKSKGAMDNETFGGTTMWVLRSSGVSMGDNASVRPNGIISPGFMNEPLEMVILGMRPAFWMKLSDAAASPRQNDVHSNSPFGISTGEADLR